MRPISAVVPKALLPLVDAAGRCRCALHLNLLEAAAAGIDQAILVVSGDQQRAVMDYLAAARDVGDADGLPEVVFVEQASPKGLGDAVSCAESLVGGESFMVLLGDHVRLAAPGAKPCTVQVIECHDGYRGHAMVGMQVVGADWVSQMGVAGGDPVAPGRVYRCSRIIEKPTPAVAGEQLAVADLGDDSFLAHAGVYVFRPTIFRCLREIAQQAGDAEIGLTEAQQMLLEKIPDSSYLLRVDGEVLDVGNPAGYAAAIDAVRAAAV